MNTTEKDRGAVQPSNEKSNWFTTPLRRDPQSHSRPEWDAEWTDGNKCAAEFMGIIRHDDAVEVVVLRNCDHRKSRDHNLIWPSNWHKRWRWTERDGLWFWGGDKETVEEKDRIECAIQHKVRSLADFENNEPHPYTGYTGIPWKNAGASRQGASCSGLVWLWINEQTDFKFNPPTLDAKTLMEIPNMPRFKQDWRRGDVVFFRNRKTGKVQHCAVCVGENKLLHILGACQSRIETGTTLMQRLGLDCVGALSPPEAQAFYTEVAKFKAARLNATTT